MSAIAPYPQKLMKHLLSPAHLFPLNDFYLCPWAVISRHEVGYTVYARFSDKETAKHYLKLFRYQEPKENIELLFSPVACY